jgi:hypothetical protein
MSAVPKQGTEARTSIIPSLAPSGLGFFGSPYSPANAMPTPNEIGVTVGNSMQDVANGVKGVQFYIDQIGFGAPSTGLTNGMPLKPLGVNYFINAGTKCSNGATMWTYMQGIPEGNALGDRAMQAMEKMRLPPLKGLAPGMIEDAERGLNPAPLMNALLGSGYPQCKQVTRMVGDSYGRIQDASTGEVWIADPSTARYRDGLYYQTRWVQATNRLGEPINLTRDEWIAAKKTHNPDGTPIKEAFEGMVTTPAMITIGVLCLIAFAVVRKR